MLKHVKPSLSKIDNTAIYQYGLLAAITLLAAILRFYKLGDWSFWFDEVFTLNRALNNYSNFEAIIQTTISHKFLPLSIILSGSLVNILGTTEWNARLVPAIIGIISVPILYFPTKKIFGWRVGMIAALLLAISTWHIFWSQNARFYTSLLFFYTLALFAFYFAIERDRPLYILIGFLLLYLAFSERFIALWFAPVIACYLIFLKIAPFERPAGFRARNVFLIVLLPVIGIGIIEILSLLTTGSARFFTESFFSGFEFLLLFQSDNPIRLFSLIVFNVSFPVMCFAFFSGLYLIGKKNRAGLFFFIAAMAPVIIFLLLNPFVFTKDRYVFVTLCSWLILTAVAVKELMAHTKDKAKLLAAGVLILLVADAAGSALLYYGVNNGNRRDWKGTFASIERLAEEGDVVVSNWPKLTEFYLGDEGIEWQIIDPEMVLNNSNRFWFVVDSETIWTNGEMKSWIEENAELIEVKYLRTPEDISLRVYRYDPEQAW
jgi:4-amino-4-deoxy-L-arabinose transferase-like glycosyltransferase